MSVTEANAEHYCERAAPMKKGATGTWWHDEAEYQNGKWRCPNCGLRWKGPAPAPAKRKQQGKP